MCTSAIDERRSLFWQLVITALLALSGGIYEIFSHGVWSPFMVYAFAFPLVLGVLPAAYRLMRRMPRPSLWAMRLQHAAIAALTAGSILQGILDIYGTTNQLIRGYWIAGAVLMAAGLIAGTVQSPRNPQN